MANKDPYEALGVSKSATAQEIKKSYRKLSKQYHPDINKDAGADAKFKEISEAYEILSDDQKKAQYDQFGHTDPNAGFGGGGFGGGGAGFGGGGFEDIFESFFGGGRRRDPNAPRAGQDMQYTMRLKFREAIFGKEVEISYRREEINEKTKEREVKVKKLKLKVPAGVDDGQQMRVSNQGAAGYNGGPNGDLYVVFDVIPDEFFERHGDDIYAEVPITFTQAALGAEIEVPTLHGNVRLKIPAGTQNGTNFRLRGKGAPRLQRSGHGDQHIQVRVVVPQKLTDAQRKAIKELAKATDGDNANDGFFDKMRKAFKGE